MSGGSMDYLYFKVQDASFYLNSPLRRLFKSHLDKVAEALKAIEWNDSGDGDSQEEEKILRCFQFPSEEIKEEVIQLKETLAKLEEHLR